MTADALGLYFQITISDPNVSPGLPGPLGALAVQRTNLGGGQLWVKTSPADVGWLNVSGGGGSFDGIVTDTNFNGAAGPPLPGTLGTPLTLAPGLVVGDIDAQTGSFADALVACRASYGLAAAVITNGAAQHVVFGAQGTFLRLSGATTGTPDIDTIDFGAVLPEGTLLFITNTSLTTPIQLNNGSPVTGTRMTMVGNGGNDLVMPATAGVCLVVDNSNAYGFGAGMVVLAQPA